MAQSAYGEVGDLAALVLEQLVLSAALLPQAVHLAPCVLDFIDENLDAGFSLVGDILQCRVFVAEHHATQPHSPGIFILGNQDGLMAEMLIFHVEVVDHIGPLRKSGQLGSSIVLWVLHTFAESMFTHFDALFCGIGCSSRGNGRKKGDHQESRDNDSQKENMQGKDLSEACN